MRPSLARRSVEIAGARGEPVFKPGRGRPMTGSMPDAHHDGIQVSAEEERYLRRAFRRFALPYLLLVIAITGGALAWSAASPRVASDGSDEIQSLVAESASLREAIASLRQELREQATSSGDRLGALEGRLEKIRSASAGETASQLGGRLDHAHQRINALEGRLREMEKSRVASPTPAPSPSPSPVPTGPAAPQDAWPRSDSSFDRP